MNILKCHEWLKKPEWSEWHLITKAYSGKSGQFYTKYYKNNTFCSVSAVA